jgi:hypothetical protein
LIITLSPGVARNKEEINKQRLNDETRSTEEETEAEICEQKCVYPTDHMSERRCNLKYGPYEKRAEEEFEENDPLFAKLSTILDEDSDLLRQCTNTGFAESVPVLKKYREEIHHAQLSFGNTWKDGLVRDKTLEKVPTEYLLLCLFPECLRASEKAVSLLICKDLDLGKAVKDAVTYWGLHSFYPLVSV